MPVVRRLSPPLSALTLALAAHAMTPVEAIPRIPVEHPHPLAEQPRPIHLRAQITRWHGKPEAGAVRTSAVTIRLEALPTASTPELPEMDELFHRPPVPVHLASGDGTDFPLLPRFPDPDWRELTDEQQAILAPFAPEWNTWTVAEKHAWLTFAERFPQLPEDRRRRASRRVFEWANMSLAERRMARANYRDARRHPPSQRAREWERYQAIPEAERNSLRRADPNRDISAARRSNGHSGLARDISNPIPGLMPPGAPPAFAPRHRTLPTQAPPPGAPPAMTYSPDGPGAPPANLAPAQQLPPPEPAHLDQR